MCHNNFCIPLYTENLYVITHVSSLCTYVIKFESAHFNHELPIYYI